ncbi:MAG: hypothetical protein LCH52_08205 [Bacteroidetes bacterium]|nr:hypothetical protein [Bacteroidota bacterium]
MKTLFKSSCRIGSLELSRTQELISSSALEAIKPLIKTYGLINTYNSNHVLTSDWKVEHYSDNEIRVLTGTALVPDIDKIPRFVKLPANQIINTGSTDGNYSVVLRYKATNFEEGTVSVSNGSTAVTGVKTKFTKTLSANRRIRIGSSFYTVGSVADDENLGIVESFDQPNASDVKYKVGGWFAGTSPLAEADNLIYELDSYEIILKTGAIAEYEVVLAKVVITSNIIYDVQDLRHKYVLSLINNKQVDFISHTSTTVNPVNQTSNSIIVNPGQMDYFPESHSADFSTCFITNNDGVPVGFKFTSKSNIEFTQVTFDPAKGVFSANTGAPVFTRNSVIIDSNGLKIGGQYLKYFNTQSSTPGSALFDREIIETQGAFRSKDGLVLLGKNSGSNGTGEFNFGALHYNESGKKLALIVNGGSTGSAGDGQRDIELEVQNSALSYGNLKFTRNGVTLFQIYIPASGDPSTLSEIRFGSSVKINRSGQGFFQSLEAGTIYGTNSVNTRVIDIEGGAELLVKKNADTLFSITIPSGGTPATDTELRFGSYITIKRYGDLSCPIIRASTRIFAADIQTNTINATGEIMPAPSGKLRLHPDKAAPATAGADGLPGEIRFDSGYLYVCTAINTWKRTALTTW